MSSSRILRILLFSLGVAGLMIATLRTSALAVVGARCSGLEPLGWSVAAPPLILVTAVVYLVLRSSQHKVSSSLAWTPIHTLAWLSPGLLAFAFIHLNSGPSSGLIEARQRFSIEVMHALDAELQAFIDHEQRLPEPGELARKVRLRKLDGWKRLLEIEFRDDHRTIVCRAQCEELDLLSPFERPPGPSQDPRSDIVMLDGKLIRWPEGLEQTTPKP